MKITFNFKSPSNSNPSYNNPHRPLRIADVLLEEEEDDDIVLEEMGLMGGRKRSSGSIECSSPHRIVARWLAGLRSRGKVKKVVEERQNEVARELDDRTVEAGGINGQDEFNLHLDSGASGQCRKEASLNIGATCCLLYLVAASKNELSKMMELRVQMENLLQSNRGDMHKKDGFAKVAESNDVFVYSDNDTFEALDFETQFSPDVVPSSSVVPASSSITLCNQSMECEISKQEGSMEGMDQLEAELEAELELLELHLDSENLLSHRQQPWIRATVEDSASSKTHSRSSGELIDPEEACMDLHCGVPPYELERRLHEVLETRQEEHIRELEAVIECLKHKLHEKEMEISWWKDTARLISQHVPEKHLQ